MTVRNRRPPPPGAATVALVAVVLQLGTMALPRARADAREDFFGQYYPDDWLRGRSQPGWPTVDAFFFEWLAALEVTLLVLLAVTVVVAVRTARRRRALRVAAWILGTLLVALALANAIAPGGAQITLRVEAGSYVAVGTALVAAACAVRATRPRRT